MSIAMAVPTGSYNREGMSCHSYRLNEEIWFLSCTHSVGTPGDKAVFLRQFLRER